MLLQILTFLILKNVESQGINLVYCIFGKRQKSNRNIIRL